MRLFLFLLILLNSTFILYADCDTSNDDSRSVNNDTSPGKTLETMNNASVAVSQTICGSSRNDDKDYYNFTVDANGFLTITTSSPNDHEYHFQVKIDGDEVYAYDTGENRLLHFPINADSEVVVLFKETGSDTDEYQATFDFTPCDSSYDTSANDTSPGVTLPNLNNAAADASQTICGSSVDNDKDYYTFTVASAGDLQIITASPNDHEYHFEVIIDGEESYPYDTGKDRTLNFSLNSGSTVIVLFKETGDDTDKYIANFDFKANVTIVNNANDVCYEPMESSGLFCADIGPCEGGIGCKKLYPIKNLNVANLTDTKVLYNEDGLGGSFGSSCGVDDLSDSCRTVHDIDMGPVGLLGQATEFTLEDPLTQNTTNKIWVENIFSGSCFNSSELSATYKKGNTLYRGNVKPCPISYCETHDLSEGFHLIDPDEGEVDNSFEIFCHEDATGIWHDLIALPMHNDANNFLFDNKETSSNYYDITANPRTTFQAIEIDGGHITYNGTQPSIPVITARSDEPWSITTDGKAYKVMGSKFSNINLIGTPFVINWDDTQLSDCNTTKLRKALGQAVKYNTINNGTTNDGESQCQIDNMSLKLLDDYRFLVYNGDEVLQHSCKEMASYIPNNVGVLQDDQVAGHFNILPPEKAYPNTTPTSNGSRDNGLDIGALNQTVSSGENVSGRPLTVYCKYQTDLHYVWTFLIALDAEVTQYKTDLITHHDSCSQLGLYFYVPNNKETYNRVRLFLKDQKTGDEGWENYTGTIEEKIASLHPGNIYYLQEFKDVLIWPYGPLGIYYPHNGNNDSEGNYRKWRNEDNNDAQPGWMSGSPMHNISNLSNYDSSMGKKGWLSILGTQDLNKTDEWWISDIGAGLEITKIADGSANDNSTYNPHGDHPRRSNAYYEPNGNYTANAWLNFLYDEEGWIYHNDDWNDNYPYYDYMCMSETNYDAASRYALIPGFFNAIEHDTRVGNTTPNFWDDNITTKIVKQDIALDLLLYAINPSTGDIDRSSLNTDENKSVGVFLSTINETAATPIKYLGTYANFDAYNGRIPITTFDLSSATERNVIQFYYCDTADLNWTDCWDFSINSTTGSITLSPIENAASSYSDSSDDFAVRPKNFTITTNTGLLVKAKDINISYFAYDNDNNPTANYNEYFTNLNLTTTLADPTMATNCPDPSLTLDTPDQFNDGAAYRVTSLTNVGVFNIKIQEINGTEFAAIDADDTPDSDRFIEPADLNLTILPDHFHLTSFTNINYAPTFTYLSNDLVNMALKFDFNVSAQNSHNTVTTNYTTGCFANNTNVNLQYNNVPTLMTMLAKELNNNITGSINSSDVNFAIPPTVYTHDHNGSAELALRLNFTRAVNQPVNPFKVNFNDINVSDQSTALHIGTDTSHIIDLNGSMVYGRTNAPRQRFVGYTGSPLIYYETYCSGTDAQGITCNKTLLPSGVNANYTNDPRWFVNAQHNLSTYGDVGAISQKNASNVTLNGAISTSAGYATVPLIYGTTSSPAPRGYPYKATMQNSASSWLIYNQFDSTASTNEFEVEFTNVEHLWGGKRETEANTKENASNRTNRRTMW